MLHDLLEERLHHVSTKDVLLSKELLNRWSCLVPSIILHA
jgi:hypothetical protein